MPPSFGNKRHVVTIMRNIDDELSRYIFTAIVINPTLGALIALIL